VGLGFNASWQPQIASVNSSLANGASLALTGSRFRGVSEGSGGNNGQNSPADYPVVQLHRLDNDQILFPLAANWTSNSFTSVPVTGLPTGYALVTVFVNGIPSSSSILDTSPPGPFQITSIVQTNLNDLFITWNTTGITNIVQVSSGTGGSYSSSSFADLTTIVVTTTTTNFWDVGALTHGPTRYYRIRSPQ
jgi:hypothetical protein